MRAHPEREAITHLLCILGQDFPRAAAKRRVLLDESLISRGPDALAGGDRHSVELTETRN